MNSPNRGRTGVILTAAFFCIAFGLKANAQPRATQSNDDELVKVQKQRGGVRHQGGGGQVDWKFGAEGEGRRHGGICPWPVPVGCGTS